VEEKSMKKKIVGIFVCTLVLVTAVPAVGDIFNITTQGINFKILLQNVGNANTFPDDEFFDLQWSLHNTGQTGGLEDCDIDAPEAWNIETGNSDVVIAIIDTGVDYTHPDLADKIWNNEDEIPDNGIDDDANGYIDDVIGWDFYEHDNDPLDINGHGTHCAGIIAAATDNREGIAGISWHCKIMPLKRCGYDHTQVYINYAIEAIEYAVDNGACIICMMCGTETYIEAFEDAVNYAYNKGVFFCASAGNQGWSVKHYPAAFENVTSVAATNDTDQRMYYYYPEFSTWVISNYGDWVDVAAPGQEIYSTMPTYNCAFSDYGFSLYYDHLSGTSMAAPHVAGLTALLLSKNPLLSPDAVKALICNNTDPYNSTYDLGSGRINAQKALEALVASQPTAEFTWTPQNPDLNQTVTFDASASYDPDGTIILYEWDWDHDGVYDESHPSSTATHTWTQEGDYPVTLKVTDVDGIPNTITKTVTVTMIQHPPDTPTVTGPDKGKPGIAYKYTITGTDPDSDMISAYIKWGDDTITNWTAFHNSGESFSVTHSWAKKGTYTVQVKVKDTHGAESGWTTLSVTMPCSYNMPFQQFWNKFFERFPHAFSILRHLLGY
jgi:subtilisin family serine protease